MSRYPVTVITLLLLVSAMAAHGQTLAFRNVTVVDANGSRPGVNVVISSGHIVAAGRGVTIPRGARTVDGRGKFLIPGLWDMHVHLWESNPMTELYLAAGVQGVRDMGSDLQRTRALREKIAKGEAAGPLIYTPGPLVEGPGSGAKRAPVIKVIAPGDGDRAAEKLYMSLADFVMVTSGVPADAYHALAYRARVRRLPFAGHLPDDVPITDAIDARQRSIEHLFGVAIACSVHESSLRRETAEALARGDAAALRQIRSRTFATFNPGIATELFRRMARFGVWQTPTLTLRKRMSLMDLDGLASAPELQFVPEPVRSAWQDPRERLKNVAPEQLASNRDDYEFHRKLLPYIRQAGAGILAGTDTGDPYVVPGFALHDELALLVEAGLTPAEALASATVQPARYFSLEATHGTVERGKIANLVLLTADPMTDIRNTKKIAAVVSRGKLLERSCLDKLQAGRQDRCAFAAAPSKPLKSSDGARRTPRKRNPRRR